jgi:hypothetical protein
VPRPSTAESPRSVFAYTDPMDPKAALQGALGWLRAHPEEAVTALKNAAALRLTIPLDALRWLASQVKGKRAPEDVEISAAEPGVRLGATVNVMKTTLRVGATLFIEEMRIGPEELRFAVRLRNVDLVVIGQSDSPVATLIQSGALDLSRPGKLAAHLPKKPPLIVEADGDRIVIDLMRDPKIAAKVRRVVSLVTPIVTVTSVETSGDALGIQLSCFPDGLGSAVESLRAAV